MKVLTSLILILSMMFGPSLMAQEESIRVNDSNGSREGGGGLMMLGTTSTTTSKKGDTLTTIGWTLIVVGFLYGGSGSAKASEVEYSGVAVWDAMIREASVISRSPELVQVDTAIYNSAQQLGVSALDLANMALDIDSAVKVAAANNDPISIENLSAKLKPSEAEKKAFENMFTLAMMR